MGQICRSTLCSFVARSYLVRWCATGRRSGSTHSHIHLLSKARGRPGAGFDRGVLTAVLHVFPTLVENASNCRTHSSTVIELRKLPLKRSFDGYDASRFSSNVPARIDSGHAFVVMGQKSLHEVNGQRAARAMVAPVRRKSCGVRALALRHIRKYAANRLAQRITARVSTFSTC